MSDPIRILHFSDVLCVWAFVAQRRVDELKDAFGEQLRLSYHFVPVLASTRQLIAEGMADVGGYEAFGKHVRDIVHNFDHVDVSDRVWTHVRPASSCSAHLFLRAVDLMLPTCREHEGQSPLELAAWRIREAFFWEARDISKLSVQLEIAAELGFPVDGIRGAMEDGRAMAELFRDMELRDKFKVRGSPSYVMNEGRQLLYGNVGYRVIAANVKEMLETPQAQASWCS